MNMIMTMMTMMDFAEKLSVKGLAAQNPNKNAKTRGKKKKKSDEKIVKETANDREGVREKSEENDKPQKNTRDL